MTTSFEPIRYLSWADLINGWPACPGGLPFSRNHLSRLINRGGFPPPDSFGERKVAFREHEVLEWMNSRPRRLSHYSPNKRAAVREVRA